MNFNQILKVLAAFGFCAFQVALAQEDYNPRRINFVKDTVGYGGLKEKALERIVQDTDQTSILRFLELEIESGNSFEAILTLENWQKKNGGSAQGLYLLGTAYGLKGKIKKAFISMEQAYRRNQKLGNNTLEQELRFLRVKANPLGRPETVNGVYAQNSLEQFRKSQSNPKQMAVWKKSRQELYAWLLERAWVYQTDSVWISWMYMDMGELSFLLDEPENAKIWYKEARKINPNLVEEVAFRLKLIQSSSKKPNYLWMGLAALTVISGLWLYFRSQRQVESSGK